MVFGVSVCLGVNRGAGYVVYIADIIIFVIDDRYYLGSSNISFYGSNYSKPVHSFLDDRLNKMM